MFSTFPYINETEDLTDAVRSSAGGSFIQLSDGICHYELFSPSLLGKGPGVRSVILIHGFSTPYFIFDPTFHFLAQSGLRVLRYDLFGRGFSDRPRVRYDVHLFVRQLKDLLDALKIREPVHLLGLSMGGAISAAFTERYPERVQTHILIDPAGAKQAVPSLLLHLIRIPLLPELLFGLVSDERLLKIAASDFFDPKLVNEFSGRYIPQMKFKGFKRAILSTIRSGMLGSFYECYQRVGKLQKPTLLFWGQDDKTVPFENNDLIRAAIPHAEFHPIAGCGHLPHYEKPEVFHPILLSFLENHS